MPGSASRNDPLTSFNFLVDIQGMRAGFSEIGGLTTETDIIEYREGSEDITVRKLPGKRKYTNINLKRGYTPDGKELWAWRKKVMDGKTQRLGGTITLLNEARQPALTWEFSEGWPSKWAGPAMNAKNNDVAIEELEICVEGLVLQA
jgi:phage tail-like protein